MFNFTPLEGALSDSPAAQYLLELDGGVKVLIGLGWDESFDPKQLKELEKYVAPRHRLPMRLCQYRANSLA
jgi:cleavage and polyadenylation specificity factor subunit 2